MEIDLKKIIIAMILFSFQFAMAEDRYWVSNSNGNFRKEANWSATSGGPGGASIPDSNDRAIFDANGSGRCTITTAINVKGIWIKSDYSSRLQVNRDRDLLVGSDGYIQDGAETRINGSYDLSIAGDLKISGGIFLASASTITVGGDFWNLGGTFNHNNGTISLNGQHQTIYGSTTFNHLSKSSTGVASLAFESGSLQNVAGTLTLQGENGFPLELKASLGGIRSTINPQGTVSLNYITVKDIINGNNTLLNPPNSSNLGNNIDWFTTVLGPFDTIVPDGAYGEGVALEIKIKFAVGDKATLAGGTIDLTLNTGNVISITSLSNSNEGVATYTVGAGDNVANLDVVSVALNGGTLLDEGGNAVSLAMPTQTLSAGHHIKIDTTAPQLINITSALPNKTVKEGEQIPIRLEFDEEVFVNGTLNVTLNSSGSFLLSSVNGTSVTGVYTVGASQNADDLKVNTIQVLGGVTQDQAGNDVILDIPMGKNLDDNKDFIVDTQAPYLENISSASSDSVYKVGDVIQIELKFSEDISLEGTLDITLDTGAHVTGFSVNGSSAIGTYTVASEEVSPDLNVTNLIISSGIISDAVGNLSDLSLPANNLSFNKNLIVSGQVAKINRTFSTTVNGSYGIGQSINVSVEFTENVSLNGSLKILLDTGGEVIVGNFAGNSVSGNYTVLEGHNTNDLNVVDVQLLSGTLTNTIGNNVLLQNVGSSMKDTSQIVINTTPHISSITSSSISGTYGLGSNILITVGFSDPATLLGGNLQIHLDTGDILSVSSFSNQSAVVFTYVVGANDNSFDLNVTQVSLSGGSLKTSGGTDFSLLVPSPLLNAQKDLIIDTLSPVVSNISSTTPSGVYATGNQIAFTIDFNEPVQLSGVLEVNFNSGGKASISSFTNSSASGVYTVNASETSNDLDISSLVLLSGSFKDLANNDVQLNLVQPNLAADKDIIIDTSGAAIDSISTTNANGAYKVGDTIVLFIQFSKTVDLNGTMILNLNSGGELVLSSFTGVSTSVNYVVGVNDSSAALDVSGITLQSGTLKTIIGNDVDISVPTNNISNSSSIVIDNTSPTISSIFSTTSDGSNGIGANIDVTLTFSEPVSLVGELAVTFDTGSVVNIASFSGTSVSLVYTVAEGDLSNDLTVTNLVLNSGNLLDVAGNAIDLSLPASNLANNNQLVVTGVRYRYWVRNGSRKQWTDTAFWSTTSGGPGGASVPGPNDIVVFDDNGNGHCQIKNFTAEAYQVQFKNGYTRNLNFGNYGRFLIGEGGLSLETGTTILGINAQEITIIGDFILDGGTIDAPSSTMSIGGDFELNSGNFTHNLGTIQLTGLQQSIRGDITFHHLVKSMNSAATLIFESGKTQTIQGNLTLNGVAQNLLTLKSSQGGVQAMLNPLGLVTASYLDVKDLNNLNNVVIDPANSIDSQNNLDWFTTYVKSISSISPNGSYGQGNIVSLKLFLSSDSLGTLAGGDLQLTLDTGAVLTSGPVNNANFIDFTYTIGANENSSDLNVTSISLTAGSFVDQGGNSILLNLPADNLGVTSDVVIDTIAPEMNVITSSAANGLYGANTNVPIRIQFSEIVQLTGSIRIDLNTGAQIIANSFSGDQLDVSYVVSNGQSSNDLNVSAVVLLSGTFTDIAGNTALLSLPASNLLNNKDIVIDGQASSISSISSSNSDGTYIVGDAIAINVQFSEPVSLSGDLQLTMNTGKKLHLNTGAGSSLTFNYTIGAGEQSADLNVISVDLLSGTLIDTAGNSAELSLPTSNLSTTSNIIVDGILPTISNITSSTADGNYQENDIIALTIDFSDTVNLSGILKINLNSGASVLVSSFNSNTVSTNYTVSITDNTDDLDVVSLELVSGTFVNGVGNLVDLNLSSPNLATNKQISVSTTIKIISVTSAAADDTYGIGESIPLLVAFDGEVSLNGTLNVLLNSGGLVTISSFTGTSATASYTILSGENTTQLKVAAAGFTLGGGSTFMDTLSSKPVDIKVPSQNLVGRNLVVDTTIANITSITSDSLDGYYGVGEAISLRVHFNEMVSLSGVLNVTLNNGGSLSISSFSGTSAVASYTVLAGQGFVDELNVTNITLASGSFLDEANNPVNLDLPVNNLDSYAIIYVDTDEGYLTAISSPNANGSYGPGMIVEISLYFNELVNLNGQLQVNLNSGGNFLVSSFNGSSGTGHYTVQTGEQSADLEVDSIQLLSGTFIDNQNNNINLDVPTSSLGQNKNIIIDTNEAMVTLISSSSPNKIYRAGETINVSITFNKPVVLSGVLRVSLDTGAFVDITSSTGVLLSGVYTVGATDASQDLDVLDLTLLSGTLKDTINNNVNLDLPINSLADVNDIVVDSSQARYWVATSPQNFSNPAYWSTTSGGIGGATVPNATQVPVFDGNGNGNCLINISVNLQGIEIRDSYVGAISVANNKTVTIGSGGVTQNGGQFNCSNLDTTINGHLKLFGGVFAAPSSATLFLSGNLLKTGGSYVSNNGTLELKGSNQLLSGPLTFHHLKKIKTTTDTLSFSANDTKVITGQLTLRGTSFFPLKLRSTQAGTSFLINPQGSLNVQYVDVKDSQNVSLTTIDPLNSIDGGNNTNWFSAPPKLDSIDSTTANGSYGVGQTIVVRLNFSRSVTLTGSLAVTLNTGDQLVINNFSGSTVSANYQVSSGDAANDLNVTSVVKVSGSIVDTTLGYPANLTLPASNLANNSDIRIDTNAAKLIAIKGNSSKGAYKLGEQINFALEFDEVVQLSGNLQLTFNTGNTLLISSFTGSSATATYTVQSNDATPALSVQSIVLSSGVFTDLAGNVIDLTVPLMNLNVGGVYQLDTVSPTISKVVSSTANGAYRANQQISALRRFLWVRCKFTHKKEN